MRVTNEHARPEQGVRVSTTDRGRAYWSSRAYVPADVQVSVARADIVAIPVEGFRDHEGPVFPVGTEDMLEIVRARAGSTISVDVCIGDDNYHELSLHGLMLQLGQWFATAIAAPVVVHALWEYIQKRRGKSAAKDDTVKVKLLVQRSSGDTHTAAQIEYEGAADDFRTVMAPLVDGIARGEPLPEPDEDSAN